jgi:transcriptional regulator with GAF, ATPase, and Fis domain
MIGASDQLVDICNLIEKYGGSPELQSVLIRGEHGVGKEKVAKAIHLYSPISDGPFVSVNCSAINEGVIESELFGHIKGAFTGAIRDRKGHFREATNGTLFLDEIGDMPPNLQAKLLRAIQEKEIYPVGASQPIKVNVRIIAATNVDLDAAVKTGKFRADLLSRLDVLPINIPPLRKRKDDIEPFVLHLCQKRGREGVRARALAALKA